MENLLEVKNLSTSFFTYIGEVKAVRNVSFHLSKGEVLGIVGESGSGKSAAVLSLVRLLVDTGKITGGSIKFDGVEITKLNEKQMRKLRGNEIGVIFQDPMTSLNPLVKVGVQIAEPLMFHRGMNKAKALEKSIELLKLVGIPSPEIRLNQYPHELSGGMRQRVMIAAALSCEPKLLIADEPTTALDVTIQAQILELIKYINKTIYSSIILITHDLGVLAEVCDRVSVMYGGCIVETGTTREIFYYPRHPYTWGLLGSIPDPVSVTKERLKPIFGHPPDLLSPPKGCPFSPRCGFTMGICLSEMPEEFIISGTHKAACWLNHPDAPRVEAPLSRRSNV